MFIHWLVTKKDWENMSEVKKTMQRDFDPGPAANKTIALPCELYSRWHIFYNCFKLFELLNSIIHFCEQEIPHQNFRDSGAKVYKIDIICVGHWLRNTVTFASFTPNVKLWHKGASGPGLEQRTFCLRVECPTS